MILTILHIFVLKEILLKLRRCFVNEVTVLKNSIVDDSNYVSLENDCVSASKSLAFAIDQLTTPDEGSGELDVNKVDKAIDCADGLVKLLAAFHAGRKIQTERQVALSDIPLVGYGGNNEFN